jgi:POT family proton-dependent oligopeptide transporter
VRPAPPPAPGATGGFLGHPAGMSSLFFTELWERFSYYGMRALLVLFLAGAVGAGGLGLGEAEAIAIYGLYTSGVYVMSLPGGWAADRVLGLRGAVLWGGVMIACGHLILAIPGGLGLFCTGLLVIVLGTGLLKPNIAALVAELYPEGGARRDAGFTLFYMAINIGAFTAPLVVGWLRLRYGWHFGFLAAAIGMATGVAWFVATRGRLGQAGAPPPRAARFARDRALLVAAGVAVLLLVALAWTDLLPLSPVALRGGAIYVVFALAAAYFAWFLLFAKLDAAERRRVLALLVLCVASTVFWSGFEHHGSSLNLFGERFTDRMIGGFEVPAEWLQSLNPLYIIVFAPLFSMLWIALGRTGHDLSPAAKFVLGLLGMGTGFLVMAGAATVVAGGGLAAPTWLLLTYLLHTWGELCLSPIGMSATAGLMPRRFVGQAMGLWYATLALGNLLASLTAGALAGGDPNDLGSLPGQYLRMFWYGAGAAALLALLVPWLRRASARDA